MEVTATAVPREIELYSGEIALVDSEDFELVSKHRWHRHPMGYAATKIKDKTVLMHRLVLPGHPRLDHRDRNKLNNQKYNLRPATGSQNAANRISRLSDPTKLKGVRFHNGGFESYIKKDGQYLSIGRFSSQRQAAKAYNEKALEFWGEYALLNPVPPVAAPTSIA